MRKLPITLVLLIFFSLTAFSQITFESGYFITNSGQKTECLIKNIGWKNNPTQFEYKPAQDTSPQKTDIQKVKEFGIGATTKFIRATVAIDKSTDDVNQLTSDRNPDFATKTVFLKVIVEGKASLYYYEEGNLKRFFYQIPDSAITQLVYKRYLNDNLLVQNEYYKNQLINGLRCAGITLDDVRTIGYAKNDLERLFVKYNKCVGAEYQTYIPKQKNLFHLSIRPGVSMDNFTIENFDAYPTYRGFGNQITYRIGAEAEYVFPFYRNKLSLLVEPTFQTYDAQTTMEVSTIAGGILNQAVHYHSIELPVGLRYSAFLSKDSKLYADFTLVAVDFTIRSYIMFTRKDGSIYESFPIRSSANPDLGLGYKFRNKYSVEVRYQTGRDLLTYEPQWHTKFTSLSLIFGYTIF